MKQLLIISALFFSVFCTKAEFGAWRKAGVSCGQGQNALDCIVASIKDGTLGKKLNCSEQYFLEQVAFSYNKQAGTNFTGEDARKAFIDGQFFIAEWDRNDLMNSGLENGVAHYFPMTGNGKMKVISSKDLNGRTLPNVKSEGTNGQACFNVCYSKSMKPYVETKSVPVVTYDLPVQNYDLPAPTMAYADLPAVDNGYVVPWPTQAIPMNVPVVQINPVFPVQPATVFLPEATPCCNSRPTPNPVVTNHGVPVEGDPGWGTISGSGTPISGDPGWGGPVGNSNPISGDPGWGGYTQTNTPNWPVNTGNNNGGNTGGNNNGGRPIE